MNSFAIMTDTVANVNQQTADEWGVYLTPYIISLDGKDYIDGVDISIEEFFEKLPEAEDAKTAVPPPGDIMKTIDQIVEDGYREILAICNGHHFTGMVNAVEMLKDNYKDLRIEIIDTGSVSIDTGFHVLHAKELKEEGKSLDEVLEILKSQPGYFVTYAGVRELDYLIAGGRMGNITGKIGKLLKINPVLTMTPEAVEMVKPIRGDKKAVQFCVESIQKFLKEQGEVEYYLGFGVAETGDAIRYGKELLQEEIKKAKYILEVPITPVLGIHTGGSIAIFTVYIKR